MIALPWIIFAGVVVGTFLFCWMITRYYQEKREAEFLPTLVAILGLSLTLLCVFLIPVDIYNASSSSDAQGNPLLTPEQIEYRGNNLRVFYYVLYGLILGFAFMVIPFAYFYYEEHDEDVSIGQKVWGGIKYTIFLVIIVSILLIVGLVLYFVPHGAKPANTQEAKDLIQTIVTGQNFVEGAIGFAICILTLLGYGVWLIYTAYGLSSLPIGMIKGRKHVLEESSRIRSDLEKAKREKSLINSKYISGNEKMGKRDEAKVSLLNRKERALNKQHERLQGTQTWYRHFWTILKPFTFLFGFLFILVSLTIIVAIVLTNADKAINSTDFCGAQCGFIIAYPKIFNPIDSVLTITSKFFPVDYIIIALIILYFFFTTLSGISSIGIRFLWVNMYRVQPGSTPPQGLLLTAVLLMLSLLALNMEVTTLAPQYATFGSQVWTNTTTNETQPCSYNAPAGNCTMTQIGLIISQVDIKTSFFGIIFYYISWAFVAAYFIGLIIASVRAARSNIEVREDDSDEDES